MSNALESLRHFVPELILVGTLAVVIVADLMTWRRSVARNRSLLVGIALAGLLASFFVSLGGMEGSGTALFASMVADDGLLGTLRPLFALTAVFVLLFSLRNRELEGVRMGEMIALLVTVTVALMWMAGAVNLAMIYLSLETVSVTSYIMVGYLSRDRLSNEASLKYILFGAVSTGVMLFGLSLLYGLTGTLDIYGIQQALAQGTNAGAIFLVLLLITAGVGFKIAAAPFHFWCPDVYTGAPTPVTAFLSVGPKAAGFAVLIRLFHSALATPSGEQTFATVAGGNAQGLLIALSVITMTIGNIAALRQTNLKRLLAYSSIAHAGTILMAAAVFSRDGIQAIVMYLAIYLFMNLGAFLVVILVHRESGSFDLNEYRGFWRRSPLLTIAMGVLMLSLMGIPPFAGFLAKYHVFAAVIDAGLAWVAVVGVLNSAVAAFYYIRVLRVMFLDPPAAPAPAFGLARLDATLLFLLVVPNMMGLVLWGSLLRITEYSRRILELG